MRVVVSITAVFPETLQTGASLLPVENAGLCLSCL
jgi:hypothetical protein